MEAQFGFNDTILMKYVKLLKEHNYLWWWREGGLSITTDKDILLNCVKLKKQNNWSTFHNRSELEPLSIAKIGHHWLSCEILDGI